MLFARPLVGMRDADDLKRRSMLDEEEVVA
jgi:hypothetical protein